MNKKDLEKVTVIYGQIKTLDTQIIEIDRFAMMIANDEIKASFELTVENVGKKKIEAGKAILDEDGSLFNMSDAMERMRRSIMESPYYIQSYGRMSREKVKTEHDHSLKYELSENATMQILGVILGEKMQKRQQLLKQLEDLGVTI